ncbi:transcriptional regulator, LacI family [Gracilibacillus ureilyticus]|uniref:Transcriptional regulator, LacI family n=1 Tax=Gracilibacillus ureilyticus TaxID=531814 RepID=A0A1H9N0A9_9BACI|nr:LacI family DNA-binding transcriptional regulator [Gracilibacillus ureilyticus]SER29095.1 transcriptional regulator, LacI family [Gracilibacillus ureilyticus]
MTVTIKDIAKVAGVSYSTVSKALNNSPLVKEATKRKILKVAEEMGYEPNLAAKQLVRKRTDVIGLMWPTIERIVLATLVTNISKAFENTSYSMILSVDSQETAMETFKKFQVDGMIIFGESNEVSITQDPIPFVVYGVSGKNETSYPIIDANHEASMQKAVKHLYELGHRNITYIGQFDTKDALQLEKVEGYEKAMKQFGLEKYKQIIDSKGLNWFDGYTAVEKVLQNEGQQPTAIIGGSYDISGGIMRALTEKGISIPNDISLVSYDNIPQMATTEVPMTCIGVPVDVLAEEIVHAIIERIESEERVELVKKLSPTLTARESSGPPRIQ